MRNAKVAGTIALLASAASLFIILAVVWPMRPGLNRSLHRAIGSAIAKQAIQLLGQGGNIALITRDTESFPQPALDVLLASFTKEAGRAGAKIVSIQRMQVDPLRPVEVPPGDFFEVLRKASAGTVVVSLLGPPMLAEDQWARLRPLKAKVVAFCPGTLVETVDLRRLFENGCLHAAVVSRRLSTSESKDQHPVQQEFEALYAIVSSSDLSQLPNAGIGP